MFLEISLVFMVLLFVTSCYVIWNLTTKQEMLEDWIADFIKAIEKIQFDLKQIDYKGYFEADDEVGIIFKEMQKIIKQLDNFKGEEQ
jgi:pyridoxal/pyridoxine/pyridoxamine kinase|tara:strand:- start:71 stop:331 length:261 start_codon:yes stop_codon:yes gene_type:complete